MQKILTVFITLVFIINVNLDAQKMPTRLFKKNQADMYVTVGLLPTFLADGVKQKLLPLNIGADFMIGDNFSIGGTFGHSISETGEKDFFGDESGQLENSYYEFALKTGLHITRYDNISIYSGFILSYHLSNIKATKGDLEAISYHTGIKSSQGKIIPGGYMGFKYALKKKLIIMAELGYGVSILRFGVGYRIK